MTFVPTRGRGLALGVALTALFPAGVASGQDGSWQTEASAGAAWIGTVTERPLVVIGGAPSGSFGYRGDSSGTSLGLSGTRALCRVTDDGATPFDLLAYVGRASTVRLDVSLAATSRDSTGTARGVESTLVSSLSGDRNVRGAALGVEWFLLPATSLRLGGELGRSRETAVSNLVESPSGQMQLSTSGTRSSTWSATFGVAQRLGEHEIAVSGLAAGSDATRDDLSVFTGSADPFSQSLAADGRTWGVAASSRLLFARRRVALDLAASYRETSTSTVVAVSLGRLADESRALSRSVAGVATWYAGRSLGASFGLSYATQSAAAGTPSLRPTQFVKAVAATLTVRWWASPRRALELSAGRTWTTSLSPPEGPSFERLEETRDRVALAAVARF